MMVLTIEKRSARKKGRSHGIIAEDALKFLGINHTRFFSIKEFRYSLSAGIAVKIGANVV